MRLGAGVGVAVGGSKVAVAVGTLVGGMEVGVTVAGAGVCVGARTATAVGVAAGAGELQATSKTINESSNQLDLVFLFILFILFP